LAVVAKVNVTVVLATKVDFVKTKSLPFFVASAPVAPKLYPNAGVFHALN
jgi:hypothetical protein